MNPGAELAGLLASSTACLDTGEGPAGSAFFIAPGYAITAAHVVGGQAGIPVALRGPAATWHGHVSDTRPPGPADAGGLYPAPDLALIEVTDGPAHSCVLLCAGEVPAGSPALVSGYTFTFADEAATGESEYFTVSGELGTTDPGCVMIKLGHGQAVKGMSGGPVLSLHTGEVIGMLRTSRDLNSSLGAWVVPAGQIRACWPQATTGHDQYHHSNTRWSWIAGTLRKDQQPYPPGGLVIGSMLNTGQVNLITGSSFGDLNIGSTVIHHSPPPQSARRDPADG